MKHLIGKLHMNIFLDFQNVITWGFHDFAHYLKSKCSASVRNITYITLNLHLFWPIPSSWRQEACCSYGSVPVVGIGGHLWDFLAATTLSMSTRCGRMSWTSHMPSCTPGPTASWPPAWSALTEIRSSRLRKPICFPLACSWNLLYLYCGWKRNMDMR